LDADEETLAAATGNGALVTVRGKTRSKKSRM
jgi:hypothetical protein